MAHQRSQHEDRVMTETPQQDQQTRPGVAAENLRNYERLHRSATDRKIAGVAGGLGRHLNIDPTVLRVLFVVLALFGGAGLRAVRRGLADRPGGGQRAERHPDLAEHPQRGAHRGRRHRGPAGGRRLVERHRLPLAARDHRGRGRHLDGEPRPLQQPVGPRRTRWALPGPVRRHRRPSIGGKPPPCQEPARPTRRRPARPRTPAGRRPPRRTSRRRPGSTGARRSSARPWR